MQNCIKKIGRASKGSTADVMFRCNFIGITLLQSYDRGYELPYR